MKFWNLYNGNMLMICLIEIWNLLNGNMLMVCKIDFENFIWLIFSFCFVLQITVSPKVGDNFLCSHDLIEWLGSITVMRNYMLVILIQFTFFNKFEKVIGLERSEVNERDGCNFWVSVNLAYQSCVFLYFLLFSHYKLSQFIYEPLWEI